MNEHRQEYIRRWKASPEQKQKRQEYEASLRARPDYVPPWRSRAVRGQTDAEKAAQRRYKASARGRAKRKGHDRARRVAKPDLMRVAKQRHLALKRNAPGRGVTLGDWRSCVTESLGLCAYCNERKKLSMDHIEPLARGGAHDPENIAAVCVGCNTAKSSRPLIVFLVQRRKVLPATECGLDKKTT